MLSNNTVCQNDMTNEKKQLIEIIVDQDMKSFANTLEARYTSELNDCSGVINSKKNNCFISELGEEFMFYSAFVRSFDSSFGKVLENMGNKIARLSYTVRGAIDSFLLPEQTQHISYLMSLYEQHIEPEISHYSNQAIIIPKDITSFRQTHQTDNYFYNERTKEHYIIELKAGGDLDNKKSKAEKIAMLTEYYLLKNLLYGQEEQKIFIYFATAYNKFGENNDWHQERVCQFFARDELLIGKNYWNFVCNSSNGFDIVFGQYKKSSVHIKNALDKIKALYFKGGPTI